MGGFHLIINSGRRTPTPYAVAREDEIFTYDLRWRRSDLLRRVGSTQATAVGPLVAEAAFEQIIGDVRRADQAAWINRTYRYYRLKREILRASLVGRNTVAYERFAGLRWVPAGEVGRDQTEVDVEDCEEFKTLKACWRRVRAEPEPPRPGPTDPGAAADVDVGHHIVSTADDDQPIAVVLTNCFGIRERLHTFGTRGWETSDLLAQIAAGRCDWTARPVDGEQFDAARHAMGLADQRASNARWIDHPVRYFFIVDWERGKDTVSALVRTNGPRGREERFHRDGTWRHSTYLLDIDHGKGDDYIEVTEADARRYRTGFYRRAGGSS